MAYLRLCLYLFVLYSFGTQAAPNPLDTININLNIEDSAHKAEESMDNGEDYKAPSNFRAHENGKFKFHIINYY